MVKPQGPLAVFYPRHATAFKEYFSGLAIAFKRLRRPILRASGVRFILRDSCLNIQWFETLAEAKQLIESWRKEYNESRPHRALKDRTPSEFASEYAASARVWGSVLHVG